MTAPEQPPVESAYRDATLVLAASAQAGATAALALPVADAAALALVAAVVVRSASRAVSLADLSLSGVLARPPLGLVLPEHVGRRVSTGLSTLAERLEGPEPAAPEAAAERRGLIAPRVGRLARAETLDAGRDAYSEAMTVRKVRGWTRVVGPTPCPLCAGLAARDEVLPPDWSMAKHVGCSCVARPTDRAPIRPPRRGRARDAA